MLVSQDIIGPLVMPVQLSASLSLLSIIPIVIYHLLSFVKPALYPKEKYITEVSVGIAVILFYVGCAISFFIVQPTVLSFVASWMPKGILFLPTIDSYLGFSIDMAIAFGVAFEIPVIIMLLIVFNLVSVEWVKAKRCWWVVGLFFLAMVLTPPDVYSQIALAVPMWVLVEFVLLLGSYLKKDISD
jgi:sec-independent protein translocase protein TatC